jgi:hypothetical protein
LFKKKQVASPQPFFVATLNARLQPMDRGEHFEDPLDEALKPLGLGRVTGGGTQMSDDGEIQNCDIEIEVPEASETTGRAIINILDKLGAPKGSVLTSAGGEQSIAFGRTEGLALYLNGTGLPDAVYRDIDAIDVVEALDRLLGDQGRMLSSRDGPTETALFFYGESFEAMRSAMTGYLESNPLCQKCRVVQIA